MQAYDSVAVEADVELGGTDQLVQPAHGPRGDGGVRARAAGRAHGRLPRQLGRHRHERLARATTSACGRPPEEQFGKTMRIPDSLLEQWYTLVVEARAAGRRSDAGEARARALHRHALARGGGARRRPRSTSRASCARARRPTRCRRRCCPRRRSGPPAGAARRAARHRLDERGAPPDRPGRRQGDGEPVSGARRAAEPLDGALSRPESAVSCAFGCLTPQAGCCYYSWLPDEGGVRKSLKLDTGAPRPDSDTYDVRTSGGLWRESEAFLRRSDAAPVFENSTA